MQVTATIRLTIEQMATAFWELDSDEQVKFFVALAKLEADAATNSSILDQFHEIGVHMRECTCATPEAQSVIRRILGGMEETP